MNQRTLGFEKAVPDKFEFSHYLFAEECMDIVGRSFMLITSGS